MSRFIWQNQSDICKCCTCLISGEAETVWTACENIWKRLYPRKWCHMVLVNSFWVRMESAGSFRTAGLVPWTSQQVQRNIPSERRVNNRGKRHTWEMLFLNSLFWVVMFSPNKCGKTKRYSLTKCWPLM